MSVEIDKIVATRGCACTPDEPCGYHGDWVGKTQGPTVILYGGTEAGWTGGGGITVSDSPSIKRQDPTKILPAFKGTATDQQGNKVGTGHYRKLASQIKAIDKVKKAQQP